MSVEYQKIKSVSKVVTPKGPKLSKLVLSTMETIATIVGATLGPGGRQVLIERFEHDLPPIITKDGVTVFRALGFEDATQHCIMEAVREASVRTAVDAGDGTTTATVLSEAIARLSDKYCKDNPRVSPQRVVRQLQTLFQSFMEPLVKASVIPANDLADETHRNLLRSVAKLSANGDAPLADAVLQCYDIVGDSGNVTILEIPSQESKYEVEQIDGYAVDGGYDHSTGRYYPNFINDSATQRCVLEKPVFVLYHGKISDMNVYTPLMEKIGRAWNDYVNCLDGATWDRGNIVLVATHFSDQVLAHLAMNFSTPGTINVYPLSAPLSPLPNGQLGFLEDLAAITGCRIFDPLNAPLHAAELDELGLPGIELFEASRAKSNIIGYVDEQAVVEHATDLEVQIKNAVSEFDRQMMEERLGKVTGGIAKLKVYGSSNGETKERRDRAEDAVCAVRGAMKYGCLPGGGWMLTKLNLWLLANCADDDVAQHIMRPALMHPVDTLLWNCGFNDDEIGGILEPIIESITADGPAHVYDALEQKHGDPVELGVLDSAPAVLEAIRNSISAASMLGTLGGTVVQARDRAFERSEARDTQEWLRNAGINEADERA